VTEGSGGPAAGDHRITHVGVCVTDLERSVRFYQGALGMT
jgi:hypothetical protein